MYLCCADLSVTRKTGRKLGATLHQSLLHEGPVVPVIQLGPQGTCLDQVTRSSGLRIEMNCLSTSLGAADVMMWEMDVGNVSASQPPNSGRWGKLLFLKLICLTVTAPTLQSCYEN